MQYYFVSSATRAEPIFERYSANADKLIRLIKQDTSLSQFDRFNKRLRISSGMRVEFTDNLNITAKDTRACYALMLKLADLWAAFEHLQKLLKKQRVPRDNRKVNSKVNFYCDETLTALGADEITDHFNHLFYSELFRNKAWQRQINELLSYLHKKTFSHTKEGISEIMQLLTEPGPAPLQPRHIFSLAYAIRNMYIHEGVAATLGSKGGYNVKRTLYELLLDTLTLYSLQFGNFYCESKLSEYQSDPKPLPTRPAASAKGSWT